MSQADFPWPANALGQPMRQYTTTAQPSGRHQEMYIISKWASDISQPWSQDTKKPGGRNHQEQPNSGLLPAIVLDNVFSIWNGRTRDTRIKNLQAASLVCRCWREPAQKALFESIVVHLVEPDTGRSDLITNTGSHELVVSVGRWVFSLLPPTSKPKPSWLPMAGQQAKSAVRLSWIRIVHIHLRVKDYTFQNDFRNFVVATWSPHNARMQEVNSNRSQIPIQELDHLLPNLQSMQFEPEDTMHRTQHQAPFPLHKGIEMLFSKLKRLYLIGGYFALPAIQQGEPDEHGYGPGIATGRVDFGKIAGALVELTSLKTFAFQCMDVSEQSAIFNPSPSTQATLTNKPGDISFPSPTFQLTTFGMASLSIARSHQFIPWLLGSSRDTLRHIYLDTICEPYNITSKLSEADRCQWGSHVWKSIGFFIMSLPPNNLHTLRTQIPFMAPNLPSTHLCTWFLPLCPNLRVLSIKSIFFITPSILRDGIDPLEQVLTSTLIEELEIEEQWHGPTFTKRFGEILEHIKLEGRRTALRRLTLFAPLRSRPLPKDTWKDLEHICRRRDVEFFWNPEVQWIHMLAVG